MPAKSYTLVLLATLTIFTFHLHLHQVNGVDVGIGERCNETEELICDASQGLSCIYETCSCTTGEGYEFDPVGKKCLGRVGTQCFNANECVAGAECIDLFCSCESSQSLTKDLHCVQSYGASCETTSDCNADRNMVCTSSNVCGCENSYMYDAGFCSSKVGQQCDPNVDFYGFPNGQTGLKCISNAVCDLPASDNSNNVCSCQEGYSSTDDATCSNGADGISLMSVGFYTVVASFVASRF